MIVSYFDKTDTINLHKAHFKETIHSCDKVINTLKYFEADTVPYILTCCVLKMHQKSLEIINIDEPQVWPRNAFCFCDIF